MPTKEQLIEFLEREVLRPAESHADADDTIRRKVRATRMRLNQQQDAGAVERFSWSAMATDRGIDSYDRISGIGATTFEDVRAAFKALCGH